MRNVLFTVGTRPESIKLAPVIRKVEEHSGLRPTLVLTGQHGELARAALRDFDLTPDFDLGQPEDLSLTGVTVHVLKGLQRLSETNVLPGADRVVVQGDTTSVLATALWALHNQLPVAHVEAGLRTEDLADPFPEEANRRLASQIARWHFAPTASAVANLAAAGVTAGVHRTGNTVVDALLWMAERAAPPAIDGLDWERRETLLVTVHRRENRGEPLQRILCAVRQLLDGEPQRAVVWPVHPHPEIDRQVRQGLREHSQVYLTAPLNYRDFVGALARAKLVLTDSGGIQEEAPSLGKPVLVLRHTTERPEAVDAGTAELVGRDPVSIVERANQLLHSEDQYRQMALRSNPFGDGLASDRIVEVLADSSVP